MEKRIGVVSQIFITRAAGKLMVSVPWVEAIEGRGLVGPDFPDRYFIQAGTWSAVGKVRDISLISLDALSNRNQQHGSNFEPIDTRRNIIVAGIEDLLVLAGVRFLIGDVEILGTKDCAPCSWPSKKSGKLEPSFEVVMEGRGGLRGQILTRGRVVPGSEIKLI